MTVLNWNAFKTKFDGKEQSAFESLCYLLFCDEFNKPTGLFRYKNQIGIETEPIEVDGVWIGFQVKYYATPLASNKKDIIDALSKAKKANPKLDQVIVYTNQEFSEGKGKKKPQYQTDIEAAAKGLNIKVVWRAKSFFESAHSLIKNEAITTHYFSLGNSSLDLISELLKHSEANISTIKTATVYNDQEIILPREKELKELSDAMKNSSITIVSGEGGTGKTALIKDYCKQTKERVPIFIFKATEFNLQNINQLFKNYGDFSLSGFISELAFLHEKIFVIDSAEKLSDIEDTQAFRELLSTLIKNSWKIVFTTRYSFLDDLKFQITQIYSYSYQLVNVENLSTEKLSELSQQYNFDLPTDNRLLQLVRNPFYLNEYLLNYTKEGTQIGLAEFKNTLWLKKIQGEYKGKNTHIIRENTFLKIAEKRANNTSFSVDVEELDQDALRKLELDELVKKDERTGGYFITHDLYEEWALNKVIEGHFYKRNDNIDFFNLLGTSLPIRRAFRAWLSEKLFRNPKEIELLVADTINQDSIDKSWKDETLISVLLSDYSEVYFELYEQKILANELGLLVRIIFLLRIACKEIDESLLILMGLETTDGVALKTIFTKPKGKGWNVVINFIFMHRNEIGLKELGTIIPLLSDWNDNFKEGTTTKEASLIGLSIYEKIKDDGIHWSSSRDSLKEQLVSVILHGAGEIKDELKSIFKKIVDENLVNHREKYYDLVESLLSSLFDSSEAISHLPDEVIQIANLYWFKQADQSDFDHDVGQFFGLRNNIDFHYFPSSAYQTPTMLLLRYHPHKAVKFIIQFTNKAVENYTTLRFKDEVDDIELIIDDKATKQYISTRLWNTYRGTQRSPLVMESMHMALERWLLDLAKFAPDDVLQGWCIYLLKTSKSASITALVVSVVLANYEKLFDVALILFKCKKLFFYDLTRLSIDQTAGSLYSIGLGLGGNDDIYRKERLKTCEDEHRKKSLEHLAVQYQFFRSEAVNEEVVKDRVKKIWAILDNYYSQIPEKDKQTDEDRTWRLFLARMDRRKMNPELEQKDKQILIKFNPEIDSELKEYSDKAVKRSDDYFEKIQLQAWAMMKFKFDKAYERYAQYENNSKQVVADLKKILKKMKSGENRDFSQLHRATAAFTAYILFRDFFSQLSENDRKLIKKIAFEYAELPLKGEYRYQIHDGSEPSILSLPHIIKNFPEDKVKAKTILFYLLLNSWGEVNTSAVRSVLHLLWDLSPDDAQSILLGFLQLKQKLEDLQESTRIEYSRAMNYGDWQTESFSRFEEQYKAEIKAVIENTIEFNNLENLNTLNNEILVTAFELIPFNTANLIHKSILEKMLPALASTMLKDRDGDNYHVWQKFFNKTAYFLLRSSAADIQVYIQPFVDNFTLSREMADFFQAIILAEDSLEKYDVFWLIWNKFYERIKEECQGDKRRWYLDEIVRNYLLAGSIWKDTTKSWHSLKDREKQFYANVANDMGKFPSVLYSISKVLNDIGTNFLNEGIFWLETILSKNKELVSAKLEMNTVYYLENIMRKFIILQRPLIKKDIRTRNAVIEILNFLVDVGSPTGYLLREDIL